MESQHFTTTRWTRTVSDAVLAVQDSLAILVNLQLGDDNVGWLHTQLDLLACKGRNNKLKPNHHQV
jgi:hypothetical protein